MTVADLSRATFMDDEGVRIFEGSVQRFLDANVTPGAIERWREQKHVDRAAWKNAGQAGLLGVSVPEEYGGGGGDFRHEIAIVQGLGHRGGDAFAISLHNPVILPYITTFGTEQQKRRWLPRLCDGSLIAAIAMTEPAAGSDLQGMRMTARKQDGDYVLSGQKTFISNGQIANFIVVAAKTAPGAGSKGISLFAIEPETLGAGCAFARNDEEIVCVPLLGK